MKKKFVVCQVDIIGRLSKANNIKHDQINPTVGLTTCEMVEGLSLRSRHEFRTSSCDVTGNANAKGRHYYWDF